MQSAFRTQIETEREVAAENSRIRHALDKASTGVLLADAQHQIIYLNDAAQMTFARGQGEIRTSLAAFDAQSLRGSGLNTFPLIRPAHAAPSTHWLRLKRTSESWAPSPFIP